MKDEFESMTAIARNDHNKKYFDTRLIQPLVAEEFIKQLYTIYNSDKSVDEQLELPSQRDLDRDIDRPYACIQNPIRCSFHESVDIDHCARMEVHRAVFAIGKHLEKLGFINKDAPGIHFPPEEANYTIGTSTFVYEKTEHQK